MKAPFLLVSLILVVLCGVGCGSQIDGEPRDLLLAPADFADSNVTVLSLTEEQSLDGPSAQVELQSDGYRVVQSLILFGDREMALSALDGIRADLVIRGETGPGGLEASGVFQHQLGDEDAASLFFIEDRGLVRLTVTGQNRAELLAQLAGIAKEKLGDG